MDATPDSSLTEESYMHRPYPFALTRADDQARPPGGRPTMVATFEGSDTAEISDLQPKSARGLVMATLHTSTAV